MPPMVIRRLVVQVFFGLAMSTIKNVIFLFSLLPSVKTTRHRHARRNDHMRKFFFPMLSITCQNTIPMIYSLLGAERHWYSSFSIQGLSGFDTVPFSPYLS